MLVPFVIDTDSLTPDPAWTPAQQRACYKGLLDVWQQIGLLAHDGSTLNSSRFYQAVQALPQSVRPQWQAMLSRAPVLTTPTWNGTVSVANLGNFSNTAQLAFVDDTRAEVEFNLSDNCDEANCSTNGISINICRLLAANQALAFQDSIALAGIHIEAGDTYQATWDSRFNALAKAPIKLVSIVDRYAIGQHMVCPQTKLSGLERFLRLLDSNATGPRHLTVYSAWTAELSGENKKTIDDIEKELRLVFSRLTNKKVQRINVYMVPNTGFRDDGHDRFVRFGDYVWDIGLGLEVFDGAFAVRRSSAGFKSGVAVAGYKQVEEDLAGNAGTKKREIK